MQRLDDLQDSSVVLLADDRVEDSLDANCWCYGAFRQCGGTADSRALHLSAEFHCTADREINHCLGDSISRINSDRRRPLAGVFRGLPDFRREDAMLVLLTSTWIEPVSPSSSVPVCSRSVSCSFPYPSCRLCRPFRHPLLLRVVVQENSENADNVANRVCFVQSYSTAFLDILRKASFLIHCRYLLASSPCRIRGRRLSVSEQRPHELNVVGMSGTPQNRDYSV